MTTEDPRTAFANQLRRTIDDFLSFQHTEADLMTAADLMRQAHELLAGPPEPRYYERNVDTHPDRAATFADYLNETPFGGGNNPVSPPGSIELNLEGDTPSVTGLVSAGRPYEGPARCMHGGYVAGLFDHFLGMAQHAYNQAHGTNVMAATRELTIRFKAPTPLDTQLTFRAWLEDVDERALHGHGTCHAGDVLTATAEGHFVKVGVQHILSTDPGGFNVRRSPLA